MMPPGLEPGSVRALFRLRRKRPSGLDRCPLCEADFVVPVDIQALEAGGWSLLLRCGQCEAYTDLIVSDETAQAYDLDLGRGMAAIAAALGREERAGMAAAVEVLVVALERDLIDAGDFARG
jgi:hypothetical protein